jgi:CubicO group peptidase (beta-lactamase class C family)
MNTRTLKTILFSILILAAGLISVSAQTAPLQGFEEYAEKAIKDWGVPGMAVAVIKDDKIVFAKGFGVRELEKPGKVDEHTLFAIGSSSKAFTAASIAMLADEGKLKLDDRVTKFLPWFELYDPWVTREVTIRDILTHRVGLERGDLMWYGSAYDRNEIIRRVRFLEPSSSMRSKFGYQNIMYLTAGQVAAEIYGKSWDDVVKDRIFGPLGMKESSTSIRDLAGSNDVATPHAEIDGKVQKVAWRLIDNIGPAGSINSNVVDMAQWVRLNLGKGKYGDKQLISERSVKEMQTPQTVIRLEGQMGILYPKAHFLNYGMGWFLSDYRGRKLVEHGGAIDGMRAEVAMIPEENVGVVVLTNLNGTLLPHLIAYRIFDAYLGAAPEDWSGNVLKQYSALMEAGKAAQKKAEAERVMGTSPSLALEKYVGTYTNQMYGDAKVTLSNGILTAEYGPAFKGELEHWNYDTFRATWDSLILGKGFVSFALNPKGEVASMSIQGLETFDRVPEKPKAGGQ